MVRCPWRVGLEEDVIWDSQETGNVFEKLGTSVNTRNCLEAWIFRERTLAQVKLVIGWRAIGAELRGR